MTLAPETTPREATGETAPAFSALDPLIRREMQEQLVELQRKLGRTIVFITHDLNEAMFLGDRIAVMRDGRIVQNGTPEEILADPANDYVAQFVQDVDRARVLTAASVMEPPHATMPLSAETVVDFLGDAPGGLFDAIATILAAVYEGLDSVLSTPPFWVIVLVFAALRGGEPGLRPVSPPLRDKVGGMSEQPDPSATLVRLRGSIDNIDAALIHMLAERFKATQRVGVLKAEHGMPPSDPAREEQQIARLRRLAAEADLDPEFAEKWFNFVVAEVIRHHTAAAEGA